MPLLVSAIELSLGVVCDFKPESLKVIETEINTVYPIGNEPMLSTIISYGVYLGEVFVRNVPGASWGSYIGDDDLLDLDIRIDRKEHSFVGYPLKRVLDFWFDRSLALSVYYQMNLDMLDGVIQPEASSA
jgi:hypothetical protein